MYLYVCTHQSDEECVQVRRTHLLALALQQLSQPLPRHAAVVGVPEATKKS